MKFSYFGTDGIRGKANEKLTPEIAYKVGRYLGYKLANEKGDKFLIGRDTRLSGQLLEAALSSGLMASGCDVDLLGVVVTPLVAHVLKEESYVGGIMISASHNPFYDNGLKIMNNEGLKIDEFLQLEIEQYLDGEIEIPYRLNEFIGETYHRQDLVEGYLNSLKSSFSFDFDDLKICVDAAHGSTYDLSKIFKDYKLNVDIINHEPNGLNINTNCGSTHPDALLKAMEGKDYDLGVAFDGDGDRLILVNEKHEIVDGDAIMYILANHYKAHNALKDDTVVVTVMSNLGLHNAFKKKGIKTIITDVGDKNVFEKMNTEGYLVGGEQSGHIILKEYSNMGDGLLVTLKILEIMAEERKSLSELCEGLVILPQVLKNINVKSTAEVLANERVTNYIEDLDQKLGDSGRILVRASGTEPLIRVMAEAETVDYCEEIVDSIIEIIKK